MAELVHEQQQHESDREPPAPDQAVGRHGDQHRARGREDLELGQQQEEPLELGAELERQHADDHERAQRPLEQRRTLGPRGRGGGLGRRRRLGRHGRQPLRLPAVHRANSRSPGTRARALPARVVASGRPSGEISPEIAGKPCASPLARAGGRGLRSDPTRSSSREKERGHEVKGRAAQTFGRFGDRDEGTSSGSLRVSFAPGSRRIPPLTTAAVRRELERLARRRRRR
jgi:hypothetical protein